MLRMLSGLPAAALVTVALFLVMWSLVRQDEVVVDTSPTIAAPRITPRAIVDPPPAPPPAGLDLVTPPPQPALNTPGPVDGKTITIGRTTPTDGGGPAPVSGRIATVSPEILLAPEFPARCAQLGVEGRVTVAFDVTPEGAPINARVVESSNRCFDSAALKAIERSRFAPDYSGGQATMRRNEQRTIAFELSDG